MAIQKINSQQVRFNDPSGVVFIPYHEGVLMNTGYDVHDIVGDTFALSQDDAERNEIPWEFGDDPLDQNITLGAKTVTMQCLDFQDEIMKNLFGWNTDIDGFSIAPAQYKELNCLIILQFADKGKNVVMPNVKMDSKTVFENLRSDIARGELGGSLLSIGVIPSGETDEQQTSLMFVSNGKSFSIGDATVSIANNGDVSISGGSGATLLATKTFAYNGAADTYTVSSYTGTITVEENAGWLQTAVSGGTITITPQSNYSSESRSANIDVFDDDEPIGYIKVVQDGQSS